MTTGLRPARRLAFTHGLICAALLALSWAPCRAADAPLVSIVTDAQLSTATAHGLDKIEQALRARKIAYEKVGAVAAAQGKSLLVIGLARGSGQAAAGLGTARQIPNTTESLVIAPLQGQSRPGWIAAGADDRGLMYAELDIADRIGWGSDAANPLSEVRAASEKPELQTRAIVLFTMNRQYWESRFYDEKYWEKYLDTLAQDRFNQLVVTFGYENGGFLAPCYPYFFDVDGYPDVKMVGLTAEQQKRNLDALNRLIAMAHARGISIKLGIWDHIYRGGVQTGGVPGAEAAARQPTAGRVWGVNGQNLLPYTEAALTKLVKVVPGIDAFQFRMHDESGLRPDEQQKFWSDVFAMLKKEAPGIQLDLRAKGLPDAVIQSGLDAGVDLRISTKYWMEQLGLPFHPTHINREDQSNRRHSYADLLHYPKTYQIHWQVFNGATTRVLLWGDPEFTRRFVASNHLYNGDGFEVDEPLATKMEGQAYDVKPFDLMKPEHRYYDYEFERYWHYFQVYGRIGYDPATPDEVFDRPFTQRFGAEAGPVIEKALDEASWILPRIVACDFPYNEFAMTYGWPEKERLGDLPAFARAEGSDTAIFESFDEEAQRLIGGGETAKVRPQETSRWFERTAQDVQTRVAAAENKIGSRRGKEFDSTIVDLKILSDLALFHARRIPAAVNYRLYSRTRDMAPLDDAIKAEGEATEAWRKLVADADGFYADNMMMGAARSNLTGSWKDELAALEKGLAALKQQRGAMPNAAASAMARTAPPYQPSDGLAGPVVTHQAIKTAKAGQPLTITAQVRAAGGVKWVRVLYRGVNQTFDYKTLEMKPAGAEGQYSATIPGADIDPKWDFMYLIEAMDGSKHGTIFPDFNKAAPYIVVPLQR